MTERASRRPGLFVLWGAQQRACHEHKREDGRREEAAAIAVEDRAENGAARVCTGHQSITEAPGHGYQ